MADWRPELISSVCYRDPRAALDWLAKAFGFETFMLIEDAEGNVVHSEMRFGNSAVTVAWEWDEPFRSPASLGGKTTQTITAMVPDVEAHYRQARCAGVEILMEPQDQFYGARTYRCRDHEGHIWTFSQAVREVSREEAETASGLKITGWI